MNVTTECVISRLPKRPLLCPGDVAAACGFATTAGIIAAIASGKLAAARIGGRYVISRDAAIAFIEASEKEVQHV